MLDRGKYFFPIRETKLKTAFFIRKNKKFFMSKHPGITCDVCNVSQFEVESCHNEGIELTQGHSI